MFRFANFPPSIGTGSGGSSWPAWVFASLPRRLQPFGGEGLRLATDDYRKRLNAAMP